MASCPNCRAEIPEDFGLVTCTSCGAQVLLEIAENINAHAAVPAAHTPSDREELLSLDDDLESDHFENSQFTKIDSNIHNMQVHEEGALNFADVDEMPHLATPTIVASADMSELADYGNSPISQAREGMLRFNIFLKGIDTVDIRNAVKSALTDERFLWDADRILSELSNGELIIRDITPVKSAILMQRLRTVSIDMRWEQYAIHQA